MEGQGSTPAPVAPAPAAATPAFTPIPTPRDVISPVWLGVCAVGGIVGIIALFLKAFNLPEGVTYSGTNNMWSAVNGGKGVLFFAILTLIFLFSAIRARKRGLLWGSYICAAITLIFAVSATASGFHATSTDGTTVHLNAAIGPIVCTVGVAIMFVSLLIARFTEKRVQP